MSQQIRNLERGLAVKLFSREGRSMLLTKQGKVLSEYVAKAFEQLSQGFDRIQVEPTEGVLTVTASPSFCSRWLVPRLWKVSRIFIPISKLGPWHRRSMKMFAIQNLMLPFARANTLITMCIKKICFAILSLLSALLKYLRKRNYIRLKISNDVGLVEALGSGREDITWQRWFELAGLEMKSEQTKWMEVTTWEMGINAVLSGHGIFLTSSCMAQDLIESGALVNPFDIKMEPGLRFSLLYDQESPRIARIQAFTDWLKAELK